VVKASTLIKEVIARALCSGNLAVFNATAFNVVVVFALAGQALGAGT